MKRITITFSDSNASLIDSISNELGQTKSQVVDELFSMMAPSLRIMADSFALVRQGLKGAGDQAFQGFLHGLESEFSSSITSARAEWGRSALGEGADEAPEGSDADQGKPAQ